MGWSWKKRQEKQEELGFAKKKMTERKKQRKKQAKKQTKYKVKNKEGEEKERKKKERKKERGYKRKKEIYIINVRFLYTCLLL